ncbi:MAG: metal-dependent transcriptional regulator [Acutalibacteraceae bacterium]
MKVQESAENYLEAILMLKQKNGEVRSIDIAAMLGFTKPSVSIAMKKLQENSFITKDNHGYIELTDKGLEIAQSVYERHRVISDFLIFIGVDDETALLDACRIEHVISQQSFEKLKEHLSDCI